MILKNNFLKKKYLLNLNTKNYFKMNELDIESDIMISAFYNSLHKNPKEMYNGFSLNKIKFIISISDMVKYSRIKYGYDYGIAMHQNENQKISFNKRLLIKFTMAKREFLKAKKRINDTEGPIYFLNEPIYSKILDLDDSKLNMIKINKILFSKD